MILQYRVIPFYITISQYNKQKDAFRANKSKLASQETSQR